MIVACSVPSNHSLESLYDEVQDLEMKISKRIGYLEIILIPFGTALCTFITLAILKLSI